MLDSIYTYSNTLQLDMTDASMAFWEPGMPVKAFDPFNIDRVKADLEDGSCLEFPIEDYYEYLIQKVREDAISHGERDFTLEKFIWIPWSRNKEYRVYETHQIVNNDSSDVYDSDKYVFGEAYICYESIIPANIRFDVLRIVVVIGKDTGFSNPTTSRCNYIRTYKITWINKPVDHEKTNSN